MRRKICKLLVLFLVLAMIVPAYAGAAAKKPALSKTSISLELGGKAKKLKLLNAKKGSTIIWKLKGKKRVGLTVSDTATAVLSPKMTGNAVITCVVVTPDKKAYTFQCKVKVKPENISADTVKITNAVIDDTYNAHCLTEGESYVFSAQAVSSTSGGRCTDKIYWVSDKTSVVRIGSRGKAKAVSAGNATITAYAGKTRKKALAGSVRAEIRIRVNAAEAKVEKLELEYSKLLKVYFNKPMDAGSIYNLTTKELLSSAVVIQPEQEAGIMAVNPGTLKAVLSGNGKELSIEAENGFSGTYGINITDNVKTKTGTGIKSYYEKKLLKDTQAPYVTSVDTDESGTTCIISFNEPVDISHMMVKDPVKANNAPMYTSDWTGIFTTTSHYVLSKDKTQLSIDLSGLMREDLNCEVKVKISGITDIVNNAASDGSKNAYITVSLITNTLNKKEAKCQSVRRNGNSLVAVFDQPIHSPGIALAENESLLGIVNPDNKKEVIYSMAGKGLLEKKGIVSVKVIGYSVFSNGSAGSDFTSSVNFGSVKTPTIIAESSFTTTAVNGIREKVLTIKLSNSVTVTASQGSIAASSSVNGVVSPARNYPYKISVDGKVMSLILTGSFSEQTQYSFNFPAGFFTDVYENPNDAMGVNVVKTAGEANPLPAPALIQLDAVTKNKVYVTFHSMIDRESAENSGNYSIQGSTITAARVLVNDDSIKSPSVVELSLLAPITDMDISYQVKISNIKGYQGEYTVMSDYIQMIKLGNNLNLTYTAAANVNSSQVTIVFDSDINSSLSKISFAVDSSGTRKYTIKGKPSVSGKIMTINFNEALVNGDSITLLPLMDNMVFDMNNRQMLNVPVPVTVR